MDTTNEIDILVHQKGNLIKFTEYEDGLYLFDTDPPENHRVTEESKNNSTKQSFNNYSMLTTVSKNKEFYTNH